MQFAPVPQISGSCKSHRLTDISQNKNDQGWPLSHGDDCPERYLKKKNRTRSNSSLYADSWEYSINRRSMTCTVHDWLSHTLLVIYFYVIKNWWKNYSKNLCVMNKLLRTVHHIQHRHNHALNVGRLRGRLRRNYRSAFYWSRERSKSRGMGMQDFQIECPINQTKV